MSPDEDVFYGVSAPAWKWDDGLIAALRGMTEGEAWDSDRNRALMLTAADRIKELASDVDALLNLVAQQ